MSWFSGIRDSWMGGGAKGKAKKGMREQIKMIREAIDEQDMLKEEQAGLFQPLIERGQPFLESTANASTMSGFDGRLGDIMSGSSFGALHDERMKSLDQGMAARGLNRSGAAMSELANLDVNTALDLESMMYGRETQQAGIGLGAIEGLIGSNQAISDNKSSLLGNIGQVENQGRINQGNAGLATVQNEIKAYEAGMDSAGAFMGSDPRLKENIRPMGKRGPFNWYSWDWIDPSTDFPSQGVMADELEITHPELVSVAAGYRVVNYSKVMEIINGSSDLSGTRVGTQAA